MAGAQGHTWPAAYGAHYGAKHEEAYWQGGEPDLRLYARTGAYEQVTTQLRGTQVAMPPAPAAELQGRWALGAPMVQAYAWGPQAQPQMLGGHARQRELHGGCFTGHYQVPVPHSHGYPAVWVGQPHHAGLAVGSWAGMGSPGKGGRAPLQGAAWGSCSAGHGLLPYQGPPVPHAAWQQPGCVPHPGLGDPGVHQGEQPYQGARCAPKATRRSNGKRTLRRPIAPNNKAAGPLVAAAEEGHPPAGKDAEGQQGAPQGAEVTDPHPNPGPDPGPDTAPGAPQPDQPEPFRGSKYFSTPLLLTLRLRKEVRKGMAEPEPQLVRRSMRADAPQQAAAEALARLVVILQRAYAPPPDTTGWFDAWPSGWPWNPAWTATPDTYTWAADPAYFEERRQRRRAQDWLKLRVGLLPAHLRDPELLVALLKVVRRQLAAVPRVARKAPRTPADDCGWGADADDLAPKIDTCAWRAQVQKEEEASAAASAGARAGQQAWEAACAASEAAAAQAVAAGDGPAASAQGPVQGAVAGAAAVAAVLAAADSAADSTPLQGGAQPLLGQAEDATAAIAPPRAPQPLRDAAAVADSPPQQSACSQAAAPHEEARAQRLPGSAASLQAAAELAACSAAVAALVLSMVAKVQHAPMQGAAAGPSAQGLGTPEEGAAGTAPNALEPMGPAVGAAAAHPDAQGAGVGGLTGAAEIVPAALEPHAVADPERQIMGAAGLTGAAEIVPAALEPHAAADPEPQAMDVGGLTGAAEIVPADLEPHAAADPEPQVMDAAGLTGAAEIVPAALKPHAAADCEPQVVGMGTETGDGAPAQPAPAPLPMAALGEPVGGLGEVAGVLAVVAAAAEPAPEPLMDGEAAASGVAEDGPHEAGAAPQQAMIAGAAVAPPAADAVAAAPGEPRGIGPVESAVAAVAVGIVSVAEHAMHAVLPAAAVEAGASLLVEACAAGGIACCSGAPLVASWALRTAGRMLSLC